MEGIGLALDLKNGRMFMTDLGGFGLQRESRRHRTRRRCSSPKGTYRASRTPNFLRHPATEIKNVSKRKTMTTAAGAPVGDNQNSLTAGPRGPVLMQDLLLIEKMAHFNRERIPERVVHAKGSGAHGVFEVTGDITKWTKAKIFERLGKKTEVFVRFSTVGGEKGSGDTERDPRGFAVKFYTEEGNWDMVGNNTPVFFVRDA